MPDVIKIADEAELIVNGYVFTKCPEGFRILNLNRPDKALVISKEGDTLETTMDDIEIRIVKDYYDKNKRFMEE